MQDINFLKIINTIFTAVHGAGSTKNRELQAEAVISVAAPQQ